jgi:hypothetical protein
VIVLEPGLVISKIYNGYWYFGRPTIEDLRQDLRAVTKKCRPDWDITTPELKTAWQQGRKVLIPASLSSSGLPVAAQTSTPEGARCEFRNRLLNASANVRFGWWSQPVDATLSWREKMECIARDRRFRRGFTAAEKAEL